MALEALHKTLRNLSSSNQLEPFIRYIRFPRYKNLSKDTRVDFEYPITALVGANGTNKSSVLRALQGSPGHANLGSYWFSTHVDPIAEAGDERNCFIYGYHYQKAGKVVEVLKTRIRKQGDPDYWEPSRAIRKYGMERYERRPGVRSTRWPTITKSTIYLDFRQSLSAFDKFFYQTESRGIQTLKERKDVVRSRSPHLRKVISSKASNYFYYGKERILNTENRELNKIELDHVCRILGRNYKNVSWLHHRFFGVDGYTCILDTGKLEYSEAFAGSGEFAVVRLVVDVLAATERSLVLLDEPEVSLHPGAQERLIAFLLEQIKLKKHQVVISTHSPAMVRTLPPEAIKVFVSDPNTGQIFIPTQTAAPEEAFFYLGEPNPNVITVVVEDELARQFVVKALRKGGEAFLKRFSIRFFPGGSSVLWSRYIPIFAEEDRRDVYIFFDGDARPQVPIIDPDTISVSNEGSIQDEIIRISGMEVKFSSDGDTAADGLLMTKRRFLRWAYTHVCFLPGKGNPEQFILDNILEDTITATVNANLDPKSRFEAIARKELGRENYEELRSAEILGTQIRRLAQIRDDMAEFEELSIQLKSIAAASSGVA